MNAFTVMKKLLVFYRQSLNSVPVMLSPCSMCTHAHTNRCKRRSSNNMTAKLRGSIHLLLPVSCACHPAQPAPLPTWLSLPLLCCCDTELPTHTHTHTNKSLGSLHPSIQSEIPLMPILARTCSVYMSRYASWLHSCFQVNRLFADLYTYAESCVLYWWQVPEMTDKLIALHNICLIQRVCATIFPERNSHSVQIMHFWHPVHRMVVHSKHAVPLAISHTATDSLGRALQRHRVTSST